MWWGIGIGGAILYFVVAFTLGLMTLRNGHGWLFFFGIFFPLLWIFGAFMSAARKDGTGLGPDRVGAAQVQLAALAAVGGPIRGQLFAVMAPVRMDERRGICRRSRLA